MDHQVFFYESNSSKPVAKFINKLNHNSHAKTLHVLILLKKYGLQLGAPHLKKIQDEIFELRIRGKEEIRLLFAYSNNNFYILHAFKKKQIKFQVEI